MAGRAGQSRQLRTRGSSAVTAGFGYGPLGPSRSADPGNQRLRPLHLPGPFRALELPRLSANRVKSEWIRMGNRRCTPTCLTVLVNAQAAFSSPCILRGRLPCGGRGRRSHTAGRKSRTLPPRVRGAAARAPGPSTLASDSRQEKWRRRALACHAAGRCILPGCKGVRETAISFDARAGNPRGTLPPGPFFFEGLGCSCNQDNSSSRESARACRFWLQPALTVGTALDALTAVPATEGAVGLDGQSLAACKGRKAAGSRNRDNSSNRRRCFRSLCSRVA